MMWTLPLAALALASPSPSPSTPTGQDAVARFAAEAARALPAGARVLLPPTAGADFALSGAPDRAVFGRREDPVFGSVATVRVTAPAPRPYDVLAHSPRTAAEVAEGDTVAFAFAVRGPTLPAFDGVVAAYVEQSGEPWAGLASWSGSPAGDWRRVWVVGQAKQAFPAGGAHLSLHLGSAAQSLEIGPVAAWNLGRVADRWSLPFNVVDYPGRAADAPWRAEARRRIERIRRGELAVRVQDARGRPVPGARVRVRLTRNAFEFGSFCEDPAVADTPDGEAYRRWFRRMFNKGTAPMYWADWGWLSQKDTYLGICRFLQREGIPIKGHPMIYPGWQFLPSALRAEEKNPEALRRAMWEHMAEKTAAVRGFDFVSWDILNELRDLRELAQAFGGEQIYADIFREAHRLDPRPAFYLNENTILTNGGNTEVQQAEYERILRVLIAAGAPVEGIGMQGHFGEAVTAPERLWGILDRFAKFGLPIQITEYDLPIGDPKAQADYTRDFITAMYAHEAVTGVTIWGFWEGQMWQPQAALIDRNWNLRPNGRAWLDLVERTWKTDVRLQAGVDGRVRARGYTGRYEVTVDASAGRAGRAVVDLPRAGATATVTVR